MPISKFKTHALKEIVAVAVTKEPLVITKRGKPIAEIVPFKDKAERPLPGTLAGCLTFERDIVSPLGAEGWEAAQ